MSLFRPRSQRIATIKHLPEGTIPPRDMGTSRLPYISEDSAFKTSGVWAALRLRADLISTMPVDVFTKIKGQAVSVSTPPVLVNPGGERVDIVEWLYSSQIDLDRAGNAFGVVRERNGLGLPHRIDLVNLSDVRVRTRGSEITEVKVANEIVPLRDLWHEKQFTVAGMPLGLSPVGYAAYTLQENISAQQFSLDWFGGSAIPVAELKNTAKKVNKDDAILAREQYRAAVQNGDLFVHGTDWEYKPIQAVAAQSEFLNTRRFGLTDITRYFGVPADMIDAAPTGKGDITYANITERNLQLFIINIGPAVTRRERAFFRLVQGPRYVKLNRSAFLAMDPLSRANTIAARIASRTLTPNEGRKLDELPPFTEADYLEFDRVFGAARTTPVPATESGSVNA